MNNQKHRSHEQSMGLWLSETNILNPEKLEASVIDLARSGFGIIRVMLRNTNMTHRSPQVVAAVAKVVEVAHAYHVRVALDCEPHATPVGRDMGELFPEAMGTRLVRVEADVLKGSFVAHVPMPHVTGDRADYLGIEAAFFEEPSHPVECLGSISCQYRQEIEAYRVGFSQSEQVYTEGRPVLVHPHIHLTGELEGRNRGRLILYVRFSDRQRVDFWSASSRRYYDKLLECYRDIPLDGVGWDEPAVAGDWSNYHYGDGFAAAFEKRCGYNLASRLYLLDASGVSPEAMRVRIDYYQTLNEGVFDCQKHLIEKSRELFGEHLLLGTHHTWQGEGGINDYRAGAVDYFRLTDLMDAGYTDCCWWDAGSVDYAYTLASSLGRLTSSGEAEVNTWHWKPTNSLVEYHSRLMTLMDVVWFNIWYGETADTALYPSHYTWPVTVREMNRHRETQQRLSGAKPVVDVAIWHGWEGVCAVNRADIAGAHKTFCLNTAELFVERCVAFDWVDCRLLEESSVSADRLSNRLGDYRVLILPYACVLTPGAWRQCVAFARAGGKLVFVGTPVQLTTEGKSIHSEFSALMEMEPLSLEEYLASIDGSCQLPKGRPEKLEVCVPMSGAEEQLLISSEGELNGIRNQAGNCLYLTDLDPRERLLALIQPWLEPSVSCHSDAILWRLYRSTERETLVLAARQNRRLEGVVQFAGRYLKFSDGLVAFVEWEEGQLTVHGVNVTWCQIFQ